MRNRYVFNSLFAFSIIFLSTFFFINFSNISFAEEQFQKTAPQIAPKIAQGLKVTPDRNFVDQNIEPQMFTGFGNVRADLLDKIGKATEKIWIATTFLSDGDIAAALYVAQYRKIDVKVLLGKRKVAAYMSRLDFLKKQNIPVFLYPDNFRPLAETALMIDSRLFYINSEMDFLTKAREFKLSEVSQPAGEAFRSDFEKAFQVGIPAIPKPIPLVGRARGSAGFYYKDPRLPIPSGTYSPEEVQGSFSYDYVKPQPKPKDFPNHLPRETITQKKTRVKTEEQVKPNPDNLEKANQNGILKAESHD